MNIILSYRSDEWRGRRVDCYPSCYVRVLRDNGHRVLEIGEGHNIVSLDDVDQSKHDFFLEIENGRSQSTGKLRFQLQKSKTKIPTGVVLIDSHGHPEIHRDIAPLYDHVFFAVWFRRELYLRHPSVWWCPNATDWNFFNFMMVQNASPLYNFGFFGSKGGLDRADVLKEACEELGLTYDIRQVSKTYRHRWPQTCRAMLDCEFLFNHSQKHDGPNQRVMESMICSRLLFNDMDPRDGMEKLFIEGKHYLGYTNKDDLKEKILWAIDHPDEVDEIIMNGMTQVTQHHQIRNRVSQILEVYNAKHG